MDKNFVVTTDSDTAETLKSLGYEQVAFDGVRFTFINNASKYSETKELDDIVYTNIISV